MPFIWINECLTAEACEKLAELEVMQTNVQTTQTRAASALAKSMTSSWIIIVCFFF